MDTQTDRRTDRQKYGHEYSTVAVFCGLGLFNANIVFFKFYNFSYIKEKLNSELH